MLEDVQMFGLENKVRHMTYPLLAPKDTLDKFKEEQKVDHVVVLQSALVFSTVGAFYEDFSQVSDEQVIEIMNKYRYKKGL
jgi:predicted phosphoribosyltransferase